MSLKDISEKSLMDFTRDKRELMTGFETNKTTEDIFNLSLQNYREGSEKSMRNSNFEFDFENEVH